MAQNPFSFGDLALGDTFTDREDELRELKADILNGQNVVVFAPRRYGKSSLVWRAVQELRRRRVLIAQVDLMKCATKQQFAAKLAESVYEDVASILFRAREKAFQVFSALRIRPVMLVDPADGSVRFSFEAAYSSEDVDETIGRLLELPAQLAADRDRRAALIFDEFQEILDLDPALPRLMRSVFQEQPDVAHVYLGSKRSMMRRLFNDANEPFWRSARQMELGVIAPPLFRAFIAERFRSTGRDVAEALVDAVLETTRGHPYATQELCYALWEETPEHKTATPEHLDLALGRVLRSENAHFTRIWDKASKAQRQTLQALVREPAESLTSESYRRRHGLPSPSTVQKAVDALVEDELVAKLAPGSYRIAEPFLAEWIARHGS